MDTREAYNQWASQYDSNLNKTRDLEALALKETLADNQFESCLEMGCGTGKNTLFLLTKARELTSVDISEEMLAKAREKVKSDRVIFHQADMTLDWAFVQKPYELITFSLVLEHIESLEAIFQKVTEATASGGLVYIGELHPFKQYTGSKARFETESGMQVLRCFNHHISDFSCAARNNGFDLVMINEYFDGDDRATVPRILSLLFRKKA